MQAVQQKEAQGKILVLRKSRVCFACLCGHMSRDCERRLTCQVCSQIHPIVLHIKGQTTALEQEKKPSDKQPALLTTCGHTGAGKDWCVLSILPVKLAVKGSHTIKTYLTTGHLTPMEKVGGGPGSVICI